MSRFFGAIRQIAFVVADIDASMHYWSNTLGIGPFFIRRALTLQEFHYYGKPAASPTISIALANSGALQIEIIQQHDELPSIYRDFRLRGRLGLQHVSAWASCAEFDRLLRQPPSPDLRLAQQGTMPYSGARLAYFATERGPGTIIYEVSDLDDPRHAPRIARIAAAAHSWDGTDPVREGPT